VPSRVEETLVGDGPDFGGYAWMANTMRSLAPIAEKLGVTTSADLDIETLSDRIRDEAVSRNLMVWSPPFVGAYASKP
jgi:hypothetical protein